MPMLRVDVSAYNDAAVLSGCLQSVRDTLGDVSIRVVDGKYETWDEAAPDNSTDDTAAVCDRFAAEYDAAGPFARERDKHVYRAESLPPDGWVLLLDADERLHTFDLDALADRPLRPRIVNARVYHDNSPVAYWPRIHKPGWIRTINRWDAYLYDAPEPTRTDRVTIIHRHDLRDREYREAKYERFEREGRTGRYVQADKAEAYYANTLAVETTPCPECGADSVTWTPATYEDADDFTRVGVCTARDGCYVRVEPQHMGDWRYLPDDWERGWTEDPTRLRMELIDAGCSFVRAAPVDRMTRDMKPAVRIWVAERLGERDPKVFA